MVLKLALANARFRTRPRIELFRRGEAGIETIPQYVTIPVPAV